MKAVSIWIFLCLTNSIKLTYLSNNENTKPSIVWEVCQFDGICETQRMAQKVEDSYTNWRQRDHVRKKVQDCWKPHTAENGLTYTSYEYIYNDSSYYSTTRCLDRFYIITRDKLKSMKFCWIVQYEKRSVEYQTFTAQQISQQKRGTDEKRKHHIHGYISLLSYDLLWASYLLRGCWVVSGWFSTIQQKITHH